MRVFVDDMSQWMTSNRLQLNPASREFRDFFKKWPRLLDFSTVIFIYR